MFNRQPFSPASRTSVDTMPNKKPSRRRFLQASLVAGAAMSVPLARPVPAANAKQWKVAVVMDTSIKKLGLHGMHLAFRGIPNVEMVAHVDGNSENIERKLARTQAKRFYTTIGEMLDKESPDIVVLTSRLPGDHLEQIRQVAAKGCHLYCEKPLTANLEEADEIVRIMEANKIKIGMAHPCRYWSGFVTMKRLLDAGKVGIPLTVQAWGKSDHRGGGEDLMTLGTHVLDLMLWFFGKPQCVTADIRNDGKPAAATPWTETVEPIGPAIGDEIFAVFRFPDAVHGIFESRRNLYKRDNRMGVSVIGSKGQLSLRFSDGSRNPQPLRFSNAPCSPDDESFNENVKWAEDRVIPGVEPIDYSVLGRLSPVFIEAGRYAAWDLMQSILEDRLPVANVYEARTTLEMIYGIYAAHLAKTTIDFPLKDRRHPLDNTAAQ